jgi:hypothetical protein
MPETRDLRVPPYLSNGARLLGFVLAVVVMVVLPILAGSPRRLF